jgi:peroxiredoxin
MLNLTLLLISLLLSIQEKSIERESFPFSVELIIADGKMINSSILTNDNKVVFIYFWHSGCSPCMQMFDAVRDNIEEWNKETNCKIIAITCQERDEKIIQLIESKKWPVEVYFDPNYTLFKVLSQFHDKSDMQFSFPTVFVFNEKWQLIDKLKGTKRKFNPQKEVKSYEDFEIDLDYYYNLSKKWENDK